MTIAHDLTLLLRIIRAPRIGPVTFWTLWAQSQNDLDRLAHLLTTKGHPLASMRDVMTEVDKAARAGITILPFWDPLFPKTLQQTPDCPPLLTMLGNPRLLQYPTIGIVGGRNASLNGRRLSQSLASSLGDAGWIVASGLARGIDGAAHHGALHTGTVAVVAGGVDVLYPPEHLDLYRDIQKYGAVVSEMPVGMPPAAGHFPRRNRIIAGLSHGVVVIEAAQASGSLITARLALSYDREVFVVPGSPLDARCRGSNMLLKDGAHLVQTADDVLAVLGAPEARPMIADVPAPAQPMLRPFAEANIIGTKTAVLQALSTDPVEIDSLAQAIEVPVAALHPLLVELELEGAIFRTTANQVYLVP